MGLATLRYKPGIFRNGTRYQAKERWYDGSLMRWYDGAWRPIGGWLPIEEVADGTIYGQDTCTDPNGTAITSHTPDSGFGAYEPGIGAFSLGASIQGNRIQRTSVGGGTQTLHNYTATTLPFDAFEYFADITRPADAANQQAGIVFRANGGQYSGVSTDCIVVYWDRVSSTLVDLKLQVQKAGSGTQSATVATNVAWAASAQLCLGVIVNGATVEVFTAAAGTGGTVSARTSRGSVTLTPDTFNDTSHRRFALWLRLNATGYEFDNIVLKAPDANEAVSFDGIVRKMLAWRVTETTPRLAFATNEKIYTYAEGVKTDITPAGFTAGDEDVTSSIGDYGEGDYGSGPYGSGDPSVAETVDPASWQLDTLNEQLLGVATSDGHLYRSVDGVTQMVVCSGAPEDNTGVVVTPEKFVVCLGAGGEPRTLQWADQECVDDGDTPDCWDLTGLDPESQAGSFKVASPGRIMCGRRTRNETLIWTDCDLFNMQYVGGDFTYSVNQVGSNCGIISPHALAVVDNQAFWMGKNAFYVYDGFTRLLSLEVSDFVFSDFNRTNAPKCWAMTVAAFGEVWFFYCSRTAEEPDRYVIFNYLTGHSAIGELERTAGIDQGVYPWPHMASPSAIFHHERGVSFDDENGDQEGTPFLESGPILLGEGDLVMAIKGFIPDEATSAGQVVGSSQAHLYTSFRPDETEIHYGPYTLSAKTDVRLSARIVRLKIEEVIRGDWRLGEVALDLQPSSRR